MEDVGVSADYVEVSGVKKMETSNQEGKAGYEQKA